MQKSRIGVFICNYNKKQYVLNNLHSFSKQTIKDWLDIYVIDNASADGAADAIEAAYPDVTVVRNKENRGGAGGFCQALKMGEKLGYEYILLADNDITLDPDAVEQLQIFLSNHEDVGMVGSKIYLMDEPRRIWIYGNWIDFENYKMIDGSAGELDSEDQPEFIYCDTVPSCCSLIKTACLKKTGYMPESNFISWDDIEWCHRFGLAGYKVAAVAASKVWHKTGGRVLTTHFSTYYYNRNKLNFFAKYVSADKIDDFTDKTLENLFTRIYGLAQKGCVNNVTSLMYAFTDFLYLVRGKAEEGRILSYDKVENPLFTSPQNASCVKKCRHVTCVNTYLPGEIYVDEWCNVIADEKDFHYFKNFEYAKRNFIMMYRNLFINSVLKIKENQYEVKNNVRETE